MIEVAELRHEKEKAYFGICAVVGGLLWLFILIGTVGTILLWLPFVMLSLWLAQQFFSATVLGSAVKVSEKQFGQINDLVKEGCEKLAITKAPDVFVVNSQGAINAVAIKFVSRRYILLFSDLIDLYLGEDGVIAKEGFDELNMIIGHELGHHAAGHINLWRNLLIKPAMFIPFLGPAYSRACELTADRIGAEVLGNLSAAAKALVNLASGSRALTKIIDIDAFKSQEREIPQLFGFLLEVFATHPRTTLRIIELDKFSQYHHYRTEVGNITQSGS